MECITKCADVLSRLGEHLPMDVNHIDYSQEAAATRQLLVDKSENDLLNLPLMTDQHKLVGATLHFMLHACSNVCVTKQYKR